MGPVRDDHVRKLLVAEFAYTYADNGADFRRANAILTAIRRNSTKTEIAAATAAYAAKIRRRGTGK